MAMNPEDIVKYKSLYLQTSWGYLNMLQKNVAFLLKDVQNVNAIDASHIAAHSLKSQSILMGYNHIGNFAALLEEIFKAVKDKKYSIPHEILDGISTGLKKVHISLTQIAENGTEVEMAEDIAFLENMYKNS